MAVGLYAGWHITSINIQTTWNTSFHQDHLSFTSAVYGFSVKHIKFLPSESRQEPFSSIRSQKQEQHLKGNTHAAHFKTKRLLTTLRIVNQTESPHKTQIEGYKSFFHDKHIAPIHDNELTGVIWQEHGDLKWKGTFITGESVCGKTDGTQTQTEAQEGNQTWLKTHTFASQLYHGWFAAYQEFGLWEVLPFI